MKFLSKIKCMSQRFFNLFGQLILKTKVPYWIPLAQLCERSRDYGQQERQEMNFSSAEGQGAAMMLLDRIDSGQNWFLSFLQCRVGDWFINVMLQLHLSIAPQLTSLNHRWCNYFWNNGHASWQIPWKTKMLILYPATTTTKNKTQLLPFKVQLPSKLFTVVFLLGDKTSVFILLDQILCYCLGETLWFMCIITSLWSRQQRHKIPTLGLRETRTITTIHLWVLSLSELDKYLAGQHSHSLQGGLKCLIQK